MSKEVFQQDLNDKKGPRPGGPFLIQMLFKEPVAMPDQETMTTVIQRHIGSVKCYSYDDTMAGFNALDHMSEFKEGKIPVQLMVMTCNEFTGKGFDSFLVSQMWDCMEDRDRILQECQYQVVAVDMLAALPALERANLDADFLDALAELYPTCEAFFFQNCGKLLRAEDVRNRMVDPSVDNMLRITSDGRKLALDQRLQNPLLPDDPDSKVNACVKNIFQVWKESEKIRGTQLVFCDLSTPKGDGKFNVYDDIKTKLVAQGVPAEQIAFIHDAGTEAQKAELFAKVRKGQVRVLIGSTQKMGAGTNVQNRIVASHDLDCPWRPADLEQRAGRSLRQGNMNQKVKMYRYVTKGTFDAYNWGLVESKQKFIGQIMTGKSPARSVEDVDATALSYAEVKALATGDDRIREKMDLDVQVAKLKMLKANHTAQQYEMQDKALKYYPQKIAETKLFIEALSKDLPVVQAHPVKDDAFSMTVMGQTYTERREAGEAIIKACMLMSDPEKPMDVGEYRGFPMQLHCDGSKFRITMKQNLTYTAELADDPVGNVTRINNALEGMEDKIKAHEARLVTLAGELKNAQDEAERPFPKEDELRQKSARLAQLNRELEKPKSRMAEQSQDDEAQEDLEDGEVPARIASEPSPSRGDKPSIRAALRSYTHPAPVPAGPEKGNYREAAL